MCPRHPTMEGLKGFWSTRSELPLWRGTIRKTSIVEVLIYILRTTPGIDLNSTTKHSTQFAIRLRRGRRRKVARGRALLGARRRRCLPLWLGGSDPPTNSTITEIIEYE